MPDSQIEKVLDVTAGMPLAMKLFVSQVEFVDFDDVIERLRSVSTERNLYDYLFETSWQKIMEQDDAASISLLLHLAVMPDPISIKELYGLDDLTEKEVHGGIERLDKLSLIELSTPEVGRKKVSLHSFTSRYVNETLQSRYE
ncbi:hypothetical protein [Tolypothrix sp. VBCCA 56010]|uniref:hypothetical protein n=1 Tax=Tolypothrix sp. VBCCA 56010 TaxID=3137731 RepID=UPI003D7DAD30